MPLNDIKIIVEVQGACVCVCGPGTLTRLVFRDAFQNESTMIWSGKYGENYNGNIRGMGRHCSEAVCVSLCLVSRSNGFKWRGHAVISEHGVWSGSGAWWVLKIKEASQIMLLLSEWRESNVLTEQFPLSNHQEITQRKDFTFKNATNVWEIKLDPSLTARILGILIFF